MSFLPAVPPPSANKGPATTNGRDNSSGVQQLDKEQQGRRSEAGEGQPKGETAESILL